MLIKRQKQHGLIIGFPLGLRDNANSEKHMEGITMTINEVTLNKKRLNVEQLEEVAGGIGESNCPRCGSSNVLFGFAMCACSECSANWKPLLGGRVRYNNPGNVCCPSCGSRSIEFLLRSTNTVKYSCKSCQSPFTLQDGHYC